MVEGGASAKIRLAFIGAGAVNFGGSIGPWNHSSRLERMKDVKIIAICDSIPGKAQAALDDRRSKSSASVYAGCNVYDDYELMLANEKLDAVFIGVPPFAHGSFDYPIELNCVRAGVHCFIEKPLSVKAVDDVSAYMEAVLEAQARQKLVVSVGYMFRYHSAIRRMRDLLRQHQKETGAKLTYFQLTYKTAYSHSYNYNWWRKERSGGPVIEQATHFCDIARFIGGAIKSESIQAKVLCDNHPSGAGHLHALNSELREDEVPSEDRVPRLTVANWRFESGAVGQLSHGVMLHGRKYESQLEAWADGLRILITDPYTSDCTLSYRRGDTDSDIVERHGESDPYMEEDIAFIQAIQSGMGFFSDALCFLCVVGVFAVRTVQNSCAAHANTCTWDKA